MSKSRGFKTIDMTVGTPWKQISAFTIPMLIGNIAQQLYNTVDSIVVGKYVGDNALAAVGSAGPIFNLLLVLFIGISTGASIVCAQYLGARDRQSLSYSVGNCMTLILVASLLMTVLGVLVARPLLTMLHTPESIIDWCTSYLRILFLGSIAVGFYNILSGVLRGLGDAVSALVYLLIASGLNIVLDILFVSQFGMGVNGVALATVIAQAVSALLCINRLRQMDDMFDFGLRFLKWNRRFAGKIIRLGLPSGITQAIFSMSMILVQSLTNSFGEQFIASNVIVMRVDGFVVLPAFSFSIALTTFAGQNIGAGNMKRVEKGARQGVLLSIIVSAAITVIILIFGKYLMAIFTDTPELIELSFRLMKIIAPGYTLLAITQALFGVMRGAGDTVTPMWLSIIQTICIRMPLAYLLVWLTKSPALPQGRSEMLFYSLLSAWAIGVILTLIFYRMGRWKNKAITQEA